MMFVFLIKMKAIQSIEVRSIPFVKRIREVAQVRVYIYIFMTLLFMIYFSIMALFVGTMLISFLIYSASRACKNYIISLSIMNDDTIDIVYLEKDVLKKVRLRFDKAYYYHLRIENVDLGQLVKKSMIIEAQGIKITQLSVGEWDNKKMDQTYQSIKSHFT